MLFHKMTTRRNAAAAVEMALILPFLAFIFAVVIDFARIYQTTQVLTVAAEQGALYASGSLWVANSVQSNDDAAVNAIVAAGSNLDPPIQPSQVSIVNNGITVVLSVSYDYPLLTAIVIPEGNVHLVRTISITTSARPGD